MRQFSSFLNGLAKSIYTGKGKVKAKEGGREVADEFAREAKKKETILRSSGTMRCERSMCFASVFSQRGEKGSNQDCSIVWEEFGCQEDMVYCGIFDGHGPWGHYVAKMVRETLPPSLLCNWQETLALASAVADEKFCPFDIWKQSYVITCATVDKELEQHRGIDAFYSGTTALSVVKQDDLIVIANVGDSRAVLATISHNGNLVPVQLTVDCKPNLPQEAERITQCNGRVFCLSDEPGVHRLWLPNKETPGLAMSRAFGDYCVKDHGLISVPEVTQRRINNNKDQFVILATDGVWDVISNEEAVQIVSSTKEKEKSAKRLVECAVRAWKRKRKGIAVDDCSAICLFFHSFSPLSC
ncbi:probable protein phosphatase 2C 34 [Typha latifolia]|uniref:probable protein phosphatase 2C 34 n=1 Tax=Typha latifolia TaxID=4733 RepID=UPI003C2E7AA3